MGFAPEYHGYRFIQDESSGGTGTDLESYGNVSWTVDIGSCTRLGTQDWCTIWTRGARNMAFLAEGQQSRAFCTAGPVFKASPPRPPTSTAPLARRQAIAGPDGAGKRLGSCARFHPMW